jgi:hypothetical protein
MTTTNNHSVVFDNRDIVRYEAGERRMAMRGFEAEYADIVDYIVRITHRIWEEKEIGYIYDTYQHNCIVHGSMGDAHGREGVVAATLEWLAAFPDRRVYADDVIWSGNEDDGFHTSHLVTSVGYNYGWTPYGPPTGKKVLVRAIANCLAKENMIFEEWLLRDEVCLIKQLGFDLDTIIDGQAAWWDNTRPCRYPHERATPSTSSTSFARRTMRYGTGAGLTISPSISTAATRASPITIAPYRVQANVPSMRSTNSRCSPTPECQWIMCIGLAMTTRVIMSRCAGRSPARTWATGHWARRAARACERCACRNTGSRTGSLNRNGR